MAAAERKKISLSLKMLIGMALGLVFGAILQATVGSAWVPYVKPFGDLFVNLLKMNMVPIVFVAITLSVASVDDILKFGKTAGKIFIMYVVTTIIAGAISACYATLIKPGVGFGNVTAEAVVRDAPSLVDTLLSIVPVNIVASLADAHLVSIIFFSVLFGVALALIKEKKKPVVDLLEALEKAILKMISICLKYAPFGVFCLMSAITGRFGLGVITTLGKFLITDYAGFFTTYFVVYGSLLAMCKINLFKFTYRARDALITAVSTLSSAATVPVEMSISESHLGVPLSVGRFAFPFGSTVNQNGTAINITACVIFSAQVYGIDFSIVDIATIIILALISSIGAAGVPGGGSIFTLAILGQFGLPTEAFGMILASYSLVDMGSTTMNIAGDMIIAMFVCDKEGTLDRKVWEPGYKPEKVEASA